VTAASYQVAPVGQVESRLTDPGLAPNQGHHGAPPAWVVFEPEMAEAVKDLAAGQEVILLSWLDQARPDGLSCYPGSDPSGPILGVFSTRSPARPNPIGLHRVRIMAVEGLRVHVTPLELLDGTPILDVKPVLRQVEER
jgi:tRNA-Thr(GGU) m(6)t(6)A37 methyltransferase TsaA